ncbi:hypothetical protein DY000_02055864 [Brassica cretica]|uniref:Uncharacterized protein n=1 Tax=Brassica cretica TaxID=69181 RepID=A0ABQ7AFZ2_BRACR|nr:hypothetical protein DY000_02055864 [Brassica cretica]
MNKPKGWKLTGGEDENRRSHREEVENRWRKGGEVENGRRIGGEVENIRRRSGKQTEDKRRTESFVVVAIAKGDADSRSFLKREK